MTKPKSYKKFRAKICQHIIKTTETAAPAFCSRECEIKAARITSQLKSSDPYDRISRENYEKNRQYKEDTPVNFRYPTRTGGK